jgi:hypothetical protein
LDKTSTDARAHKPHYSFSEDKTPADVTRSKSSPESRKSKPVNGNAARSRPQPEASARTAKVEPRPQSSTRTVNKPIAQNKPGATTRPRIVSNPRP